MFLNKQQYLTRLEIKLSTTRADCIIVLIKIVFMEVLQKSKHY